MRRQFLRIISQNPDDVKNLCIDRDNLFHFACRKLYWDNQTSKKNVKMFSVITCKYSQSNSSIFTYNFKENGFNRRFQKYYQWITFFMTSSTAYNMSLFLKKVFLTYTMFKDSFRFLMVIVSVSVFESFTIEKPFSRPFSWYITVEGFLNFHWHTKFVVSFWFLMVIVSVNDSENIAIEWNFSRPFQRYIMFFYSSKTRWLRKFYMFKWPWESAIGKWKSFYLSGFYSPFNPLIFFKITSRENYDRNEAQTFRVDFLDYEVLV